MPGCELLVFVFSSCRISSMRISSKFLGKVALICALVPLLYVWYNYYANSENPKEKAPVINSNADSLVHKKPQVGLSSFSAENPLGNLLHLSPGKKSLKRRPKNIQYPKHEIEIWGKASIAEYLWSHILDANYSIYSNGLIKHGEAILQNLHFRFRSGPGIVPNTVPTNVKYLVLILNGKDDVKIKISKNWLDYLGHFDRLKNVALVILGDEKCNNDWLLPYLKTRGGVLDLVLLIYDSKLIDNREFFQWPLGVATYRGFPNVRAGQVNPDVARQHLCSFLGTIYKNSSREVLHNILKKSNKCFVASRDTWVPVETYDSMGRYIKKLTDSDLILNPVGQNTECYRIYEALSLGSVPVVENVVTPGNCDTGNNAPLRLLKKYNAPLIFIENWNNLDEVLETEMKLTLEQKIERRKRVIKWYADFKHKLKNKFIDLIKKHFFNEF